MSASLSYVFELHLTDPYVYDERPSPSLPLWGGVCGSLCFEVVGWLCVARSRLGWRGHRCVNEIGVCAGLGVVLGVAQ